MPWLPDTRITLVLFFDSPAPITSSGFWVGWTSLGIEPYLGNRLTTALNCSDDELTPLNTRLRELYEAGRLPGVLVLAEDVPVEGWEELRTMFVSVLRAAGYPLLNGGWSSYTDAGLEPDGPPTLVGREERIMALMADGAWRTTGDVGGILEIPVSNLRHPMDQLVRDRKLEKERCNGYNGKKGTYLYRLAPAGPLDFSGLQVH